MKLARSITQKVAWSTAIQYIGKVAQIAVGIIIVKWVTNALGPEAFGQYGRIVEYVLFFSVAANLGIFGNIVRKMSDAPEDGRLFTNALMLRAGLSIIFFIIGIVAAFTLSPSPVFLAGMLFFMASLFFDHLTSICNAALQANYWMGRSVFAMTLARFAELGFVYLLVQNSSAMTLYFLAPLGASIVALGLSTFFVRRKFSFDWRPDKALMKNIFLTALPFGIINIINNLYFRFLPSFFVGKALTNEQFSFYSLSLNIAMTASLFSTFLMFSVLPAFKHSLTEGHKRRAKNMFQMALLILVLGSIAMVGIGTLLGPWTIGIVSNQDFWQNDIAIIYPLLLVLAAVSYFYDLILITIFALEKESWLLKREFIALAIGGSIMTVSLFLESNSTRVTWVIAGAICAELFLVTISLRKIRQWLK
jgi:O-antigen/teichoic acid export membrane protein